MGAIQVAVSIQVREIVSLGQTRAAPKYRAKSGVALPKGRDEG